MKTAINEYIEQNKLCSEYIFSDYKEFLELLLANDGAVEMIVWYDYCKIEEQSESLGAGGYIDKKNNDYMWAETQIYENGFLYPAFYIAE